MKHTSDLDQSDDTKDNAGRLAEELENLFKDIPELRQCKLIKLRLKDFEQMSNMRFVVFYEMIRNSNIECVVSPKTFEYIEARRQGLALNKVKSRTQEKETPFKIGQK
jgi:hypothetical protein